MAKKKKKNECEEANACLLRNSDSGKLTPVSEY